MLAIVNAQILTCGAQGDFQAAGILIQDGKIVAVGANLEVPDEARVIDAAGLIMTPGFVDAHTHLGMSWQELSGEADTNESTSAVNPHLRAIDSVNFYDVAFTDALEGGVTTAGILPGKLMIGAQHISPIAGQAVVIKSRGDVRSHEVLADPAGMKLALGTDVAGFLNERKIGPNSRMGIAALVRKTLEDARRYADGPHAPGSTDLKLESLVPIVSGQLPAHVHAHEADDILAALRLAEEFGLKLVIHHATEAHLVADAIAAAGVPCVVGPITVARESGRETRNLSERTPGILAAKGVKVALMTDHPTEPVQILPVIAGQAVREGMAYADALRSVTINAAEILGVADRVGSIEEGKDADLVLHDGDPLEAMTHIRLVVADGEVILDRTPVAAGGAA